MKKLLVSATIALTFGASGAASAADLPVKAPPPVLAYSWTGCYVGGHAGGLWARKEWTLEAPDPITPLGSHNANSWLGGAQAGCDYQFAGRWVIGVQGDYAWTNAKGSFFDVVDGVTDQSRIRALSTGTARLRVGPLPPLCQGRLRVGARQL